MAEEAFATQDVVREITRFLIVRDIFSLRRVSQSLYKGTSHPTVWADVTFAGKKAGTTEALTLAAPLLKHTLHLEIRRGKISHFPEALVMTNLQSLSLRASPSFRSVDQLIHILETNPNLTDLDLTLCTSLSSKMALLGASPKMTQLQKLVLGSMNLLEIKPILKNAKNLLLLDLNGNYKVTADSFMIAYSAIPKSLTNLNLRACPQLDDSVLSAFCSRCTNLTYLNAGNCSLLTKNCLKDVSSLTKLKTIAFANATNLVFDGSNPLSFPDLKSINVSKTGITTEGLDQILARSTSNITYLNLQSTSISDEAIASISLYCPKLNILDLTSCPNITQVKGLSECRELGVLDLKGTNVSNHEDILSILEMPQLWKIELSAISVNEEVIEKMSRISPVLSVVLLECFHLDPGFLVSGFSKMAQRLLQIDKLLKVEFHMKSEQLEVIKESVKDVENLSSFYCIISDAVWTTFVSRGS